MTQEPGDEDFFDSCASPLQILRCFARKIVVSNDHQSEGQPAESSQLAAYLPLATSAWTSNASLKGQSENQHHKHRPEEEEQSGFLTSSFRAEAGSVRPAARAPYSGGAPESGIEI